jgi:hypothetical protein
MRLTPPTAEHTLRLKDGELSSLTGRIEVAQVAAGSKSERQTVVLRLEDESICLLWFDGVSTFGPPALIAFDGWHAEVEGEWKYGKLKVSQVRLADAEASTQSTDEHVIAEDE